MEQREVLRQIGLQMEIPVTVGTNGHSQRLRFLITGGCGYFGFNLAQTLHSLGAHVILLDLQLPAKIEKCLDKHFEFIRGDVRNYSTVHDACIDVDCVYHIASFGLSGKDQLIKSMNEQVNVSGTKNIIRACQEVGVTRLIYTSTYNVVLQGKPIRNGNESLPYGDPCKMSDYYSASKTKADQLVLQANGSQVSGGRTLATCCLRPAGIYGPGERRHMERAVTMIERRMVVVRIGDAIVDWVHVYNLVQAHLLALPALSQENNCVAAGKGYFISDNERVRCFDFLEPLFAELGRPAPRYKCPMAIVYYAAFFMEYFHLLLRPIVTVEPLITRTEVLKLGLDHNHSMENAINDLKYKPVRYDFADVVKLYLKERRSSSSAKPTSSVGLWTKAAFAMVVLFLFLSFLC